VIYLILVFYIILKTVFFETKQDMFIILGEKTRDYQWGWKLYGALIAATEIAVLSVFSGFLTSVLHGVVLFGVLSFTYSLAHDGGMGYRLTGSIFHLGNNGWDAYVKRIFQGSGKVYFGFRCFWLLLLSLIYFAI